MKKIFILVVVIGFLVSNVCYAQSAEDAIKALKRLEARTEMGINYRDYSMALGDTWIEVKLFLESPEAKSKPKLVESAIKIMDLYKFAHEIWRSNSQDGIMIAWKKASEELKKIEELK